MLNVVNHDTTADPDESGTGATDRGTLKVFQVVAGQTKTLSVDLQQIGDEDKYAVELKRLEVAGVENAGTLVFAADAAWTQHNGPPDWWTDPGFNGYTWPGGPSSFDFDITVDGSTPNDFYDLEFAVAGKEPLFYGDEHFYLQVVPEPTSMAILSLIAGGGILLSSIRRRRQG